MPAPTGNEIARAVQAALGRWLDVMAARVVTDARANPKARGATIRAQRGGSKVRLTARGKNAHLAMTSTVNVPLDGLPPPRGQRAWRIEKPWGEVRYRSRNYTKYGGQKVTIKGYLDVAVKRRVNSKALQQLNVLESATICSRVGQFIVQALAHVGVRAVATSNVTINEINIYG